MKRYLLGIILVFLILSPSVYGQTEGNPPPYLYYYSKIFGGIIIERADGTDSRLIGTEALPPAPKRTGIAGPGWSPSGRYFAGYGVNYGPYRHTTLGPFVFGLNGEPIATRLNYVTNIISMQWSPNNNDLLLVFGGNAVFGLGLFIWIFDVPNNRLLAELGFDISNESPQLGQIDWEDEQVVIDLPVDIYDWPNGRYFRATMQYDGTVIKQPITREEHRRIPYNIDPLHDDHVRAGRDTSPSGIYTTYLGIMTNTITGAEISLPRHSQSTQCGDYIWTEDERYIISIDGTIIAGGGCSYAVIGVTDNEGQLWRELGYCSWDSPPCIGWLPERVDVESLPSGSDKPVQLEPTQIDLEEHLEYIIDSPLTLFCEQYRTASIHNGNSDDIIYALTDFNCPYTENEQYADEGIEIAVAYNPKYGLLAIYQKGYTGSVTIWRHVGEYFVPILPLNTDGFKLEFTEDGEYLRARNLRGWKVFAVSDILASTDDS